MFALRTTASADKQAICEFFAIVREDGLIFVWQQPCSTAAKKALADAAVLCCLMAMNTQRVALSMATNT